MSLVSICSAVLDETGWPGFTTVASNQDGTAKQIFAIAKRELEQLSISRMWPHLEVEYTFNTVAGQSRYDMPEDYRIPVYSTVFNAVEYYRLKGSLNEQEWQNRKYGLLSSLTGRKGFRQGYNMDGSAYIDIDPVPVTAQQFVLFYMSNTFVLSDDGVSKPTYEQDTDVSKIPEHLVELGVRWRFRRAKGLDFSVELAEYNTTVPTEFARFKGSSDISVGAKRLSEDYVSPGYVRDTEFGV